MTKADMKEVIKAQAEEIRKLRDWAVAEVNVTHPIKGLGLRENLLCKSDKNAVVSLRFKDGMTMQFDCKPLRVKVIV